MSGAQLVVRNGAIVIPEAGILHGHVVIDDGIVTSLLPSSQDPPTAQRTIDADGRYVLPGALDAHCHYGLLPPMSRRMEPETASAASVV